MARRTDTCRGRQRTGPGQGGQTSDRAGLPGFAPCCKYGVVGRQEIAQGHVKKAFSGGTHSPPAIPPATRDLAIDPREGASLCSAMVSARACGPARDSSDLPRSVGDQQGPLATGQRTPGGEHLKEAGLASGAGEGPMRGHGRDGWTGDGCATRVPACAQERTRGGAAGRRPNSKTSCPTEEPARLGRPISPPRGANSPC